MGYVNNELIGENNLLYVQLTGSKFNGFRFLSTEGANLGDGCSGFDDIESESDSLRLGLSSRFTTGGGISCKSKNY